MYEPRLYRGYTKSYDLASFEVVAAESDLFISADYDLRKEAQDYLKVIRKDLRDYIARFPEFQKTLEPIAVRKESPQIVKDMAAAAKMASVGPMAAVAGAVAEYIGKELLKLSNQVIVENGGDIFISSRQPRIIGIYAGRSQLSQKIAIEIGAGYTPCGVCTSSGTVGHSLSFGKADAACIVSKSAILADAVATAVGNIVQTKADIDKAISYGRRIKGVDGILIIAEDTLGAWGNIKLVDI
jgi:ApbE superfamily uncharacterized protein (UPF0280 family)